MHLFVRLLKLDILSNSLSHYCLSHYGFFLNTVISHNFILRMLYAKVEEYTL